MEPVSIGGLTLYPFGAVLAAGVLAGALWSWRSAGGSQARRGIEIFWLLAIPLGLVLAHLGYCLCSLDMIEDYFWETLADFAGGGYLLYGAVLGAAIALACASMAKGFSFAEGADLLAGPFLLIGALCALGEGLIGGGYGWKVEDWFQPENGMSLFALEDVSFFSGFPFAVKDTFYGYANWAVFLPAAALMLLGLIPLARARDNLKGGRAVLSLSWYAAVRILYESLRQDDIPKWGFVRVNQILSAVALLALLVICAVRGGRKPAGPSWGLFAGGAALVLAMEFALEKKIGFLEWMPMDLCYVFSALGCGLLFLSVDRLRRGAFGFRKNRREKPA